MGVFEYLSVLISIILALGMTCVLAGVGHMLQDFRFLCKNDSRQPSWRFACYHYPPPSPSPLEGEVTPNAA